MVRFFLVFVGVLAALFAFEVSKFGETHFVVPFTDALAQISAWLIKLFDSEVHSYGKIIQSTANGFAVSIERGCNGIEAIIILVAALAAFPSTWKQKLAGFVVGFFAIQLPGDRLGYTRDGAFALDAEGRIVTTEGYPLVADVTVPPEAQLRWP